MVDSDNHGHQVIPAAGKHQRPTPAGIYGNEMRYRVGSLGTGPLEGDYVQLDLVSIARGLGATVFAAGTRDEVLDALARARETDGPAVIVVPTAPHENLPPLRRLVGRRTRRRVLTAVAGGEARGLPGRARDAAVVRMSLRDRLRAGEPTLGTFLNLGSPLAAEACALAGFDWLLVDLEHGAGEDALVGQLLAAAAHGVPALVRVESAERIRAGRRSTPGPPASCSRAWTRPSRCRPRSPTSGFHLRATAASRPTTAPAASGSAPTRWTAPTTRSSA